MSATSEDPKHHSDGPFYFRAPFGLNPSAPHPKAPERARSPIPDQRVPHFLRWAVQPYAAFSILFPFILFWGIAFLSSGVFDNPFAHTFLLSGRILTSPPNDPRYAKSWWDLAFIAYYVIFWSLVRQSLSIYILQPIARYFGLKKPAKIDRFCEQGYALIYFGLSGFWGYRIMTQLPTYWYRTETFWLDYPHWDMKPELKRYYLMQCAYWCQQFIVLVLGLEKPRKDYRELVAHHIVTLWLVCGSYLMNFTLFGNAVFMSMDIPDAFLALSKLLNYMQWNRAKVVALLFFIGIWSYFRHYLNFVMLHSVWTEYDLAPETSKHWVWSKGTYLAPWVKHQIFAALFLLQLLNLFWYFLILRILWRAITTRIADDDRSDDEDNGEDVDEKGN